MERKVSKLLFFFFAIFETIIKSMKFTIYPCIYKIPYQVYNDKGDEK